MNNVSTLLELMNCEDSLYKFVQAAWPAIEGTTPFIANWHIEAICEHLEAATRGEIKNLIISVPPRTSKTTIISIMWPAWVWIKNPKVKFLFASYAQKISWEHSRLCKMLIESQWYQDRWSHVVQLSKDQVTKGHFTNTAIGHRIATSVGAGGTALGGDILVCDDPNDAGESEVVSNSTNDWVSRVWPSRLNPGGLGVNVLVQQRTREMDVSGHKMKTDQDNKIVKLILPMELEKATRARTIILPSTKGKIWEDPRKKEGELLCPQYLDEAAIRQRKLELGSYNYATQYQQRPAPPEGGLIKRDWFLIWEKENFPKFNYIVQSWDCAMIGENTKGQKKVAMSNISYSACTTWGLFEHNKISHLMLISAWRGKVDYPELLNRARRLQQNFLDIEEDTELKPDYNLRPDRVLIESKALGYSLDKDLSSKGLISTGFNPGEFGDKDRRVHLSTPYMECGRIWVKKDIENKRLYSDHQTLVDSAVMFPNAEGRDLVDTMTQVILYLSKKERRLVHVMNRSFENDFSEDIKQTKAKDR